MEPCSAGLANRWRSLFWRQTQGERPLYDAPFMVGACCSVRRRAVLQAGGFSERFSTNGEDVELAVRLRRSGQRVLYDPLARVFHLRSDTASSLLAMVFRHSRDHVRALRLHGQPAAPVLLGALRWGPVSVGSSLRRHHSPALAGLSLAAHGASLAGCLVAYTWSMITERV